MILATVLHGIGSNWEIALPYNFAVLAFAAYFVHVLVRREKYPGTLELLAAFCIFGTSLASIRSETSRTVFFEVSCRFALATVGWGLCTLLVIQVATRHSTSQWVSLSSRVLGATVGFTLLLAPFFALGLWNASIIRLAESYFSISRLCSGDSGPPRPTFHSGGGLRCYSCGSDWRAGLHRPTEAPLTGQCCG